MSIITSSHTESIFPAYIKARKVLAPIYKDSNGFKDLKYADLPQIIEVIHKAASANELAFLQSCGKIRRYKPKTTLQKDSRGNDVIFREPNHIIVIESMLIHNSGEWMASKSEFVVDSNMPSRTQNCGATITYARRYGALAFWFMAAEDEIDGKAQANYTASYQRPETKADKVIVYNLSTLKEYISRSSDPKKTETHIINSHKGPKIISLEQLDDVAIASWCHTLYQKMQEGKDK